jgi:hypothetical protein
LRGQIIFANVSRSRDGEQPTFMEQALGAVKVLMQFSPDGSELHVMENPHSAAPKFEILKRVASAEEVKIGS